MHYTLPGRWRSGPADGFNATTSSELPPVYQVAGEQVGSGRMIRYPLPRSSQHVDRAWVSALGRRTAEATESLRVCSHQRTLGGRIAAHNRCPLEAQGAFSRTTVSTPESPFNEALLPG